MVSVNLLSGSELWYFSFAAQSNPRDDLSIPLRLARVSKQNILWAEQEA